jgi:hypothetical protein
MLVAQRKDGGPVEAFGGVKGKAFVAIGTPVIWHTIILRSIIGSGQFCKAAQNGTARTAPIPRGSSPAQTKLSGPDRRPNCKEGLGCRLSGCGCAGTQQMPK